MPNPPAPEGSRNRSPYLVGLAGRCPRCGKRSIFGGFLKLRSRCPSCDLDLAFIDTGDGPAFFASFIGGFLLLGAGVWMQLSLDPPAWAYVVLFVVGAAVVIAMIRPLKGLLAALQYANKAEQGRFE